MAFTGENGGVFPAAPDATYVPSTFAPPAAPASWPAPPAAPTGWPQPPAGVPAQAGPTAWPRQSTPPQYQRPAAPQYQAPYGSLPIAPPAVSPRCNYCGSMPTASVDFRGQHGYIIYRRTFRYRGPFCRDCGIATFRKATGSTLVGGWYGYISLLSTPVYLITNLVRRRAVANLSPPQNPLPGRSPLPVGRPLYQRWQILGLFAPFAVVALIIGIAVSSGDSNNDGGSGARPIVGSCVLSDGTADSDIVNCSANHDGMVSAIVQSSDDCPATTEYTMTSEDATDTSIYCVSPS
jgi:hypothetical protein